MAVFFTRRGEPPSLGTRLGDLETGTIVHIKENGVYQDYLVVHQGLPGSMYDSSCNGTWMLRSSIYSKIDYEPGWVENWETGNNYRLSAINQTLNSSILGLFDEDIQGVIKQVKIPYYNGVGSDSGGTGSLASGSNGLSCKLFLLSWFEVGENQDTFRQVLDGSKLSYFLSNANPDAKNKRIFKYNGSAYGYWLRTTSIRGANNVYGVSSSGRGLEYGRGYNLGVLPAFVLPPDLLVDDNNNILV